MLLAAFALPVVSYRLFEAPIRFSQWARQPQPLLFAVAVSVLTVVVLATSWVSSINAREAQLAASVTPVRPLSLAPAPQPANAGVQSTSVAAATTADVSQVLPAVIHEVNLESHHRAMPAALNPPVGQLLSDVPEVRGSCIAGTGQVQSQICHLGASSSSKTIVLLGDSHAQAWLPDVMYLAHGNWSVVPLIKEGCSPSRWIHSTAAPYCPPRFRWAMREADALRPNVTVIAGHYDDIATCCPHWIRLSAR